MLAEVHALLAELDDVLVFTGSGADAQSSRDAVGRTRAALGARVKAVLLLDDADLLDRDGRAALAALAKAEPGGRAVITTTIEGLFADAVTVPVRPLAGPWCPHPHGADPVLSSEASRFLLQRLRRRNPAIELTAADAGAVARICAASFGIPADLELFAQIIDRHGLAAVDKALGEDHDGLRRRLVELIGAAPATSTALTADETVLLASVLSAPGGASVSMLQQSLPRCDIDGLARSLAAKGLVIDGAGLVPGAGHGLPGRLHVRVSGLAAANWCTSRPEVPFAAIRQAQADYVSARIRRMAAELCSPLQASILAEFQHERRNLQAALMELLDAGRYERAVALMLDSLPLLARTSGVADLLPFVLRVIRAHTPANEADSQALDLLAVRVLIAAGEQEAAEFCFERLVARRAGDQPPPRGVEVLGVLAVEQTKPGEAAEILADCVGADLIARDLANLCESASAYFSTLMQAGEHERVTEEYRALLFEAMRGGDDYTTALMLLWRAAASTDAGCELLHERVERALAKLRPLGPEALLSAVDAVVGGHRGRTSHRGLTELAMLVGALWSADWPWTASPADVPPALPSAAARIAARLEPAEFARWFDAGRKLMPTEAVCRAFAERSSDAAGDPGDFDPLGLGVGGGPVSSGRLREHSKLTRRESDVASLVAAGLTNKQIARRLGISIWTVTNHLRQVMRKLSCGSRVQVANWVRDVEGDVVS